MIFVITLIVLIHTTVIIIIIIMIIITKRSHVSKVLFLCLHPFHHSLLLNSTNFSTSAN